MEIRTRAVGPWPMNTYVLVCPVTRQSVLVDPGAEPETLSALLQDTIPTAILLTHTHRDHIGALDVMRQQLGVPLQAHRGPHANGVQLDAERWLADGDTVTIGLCGLRACATPGHSADMLSFVLVDDHRVLVGDTVFDSGPGRTWSVEGFQTTLVTLRQIVLAWPDTTICYPGHGPSFCLGDRRAAIEAFVDRDHGAFFGDATWS
ncbi:MAG: MBL fold metallo-hydrolase [Chloroflexaceae bacterium]|nr:MBL fold metallo-hydrolase [Chloroflexaceae bacterium]